MQVIVIFLNLSIDYHYLLDAQASPLFLGIPPLPTPSGTSPLSSGDVTSMAEQQLLSNTQPSESENQLSDLDFIRVSIHIYIHLRFLLAYFPPGIWVRSTSFERTPHLETHPIS